MSVAVNQITSGRAADKRETDFCSQMIVRFVSFMQLCVSDSEALRTLG